MLQDDRTSFRHIDTDARMLAMMNDDVSRMIPGIYTNVQL
jgi:hypothetical protein